MTTITPAAESVDEVKVHSWPRLAATISPVDDTGLRHQVELSYIGKTTVSPAPGEYLARALVLAEAARHAVEYGRPIAVNVNPESEESLKLAVRPSGIVQERDEDNTIGDATGLLPAEFPCFRCNTDTPLIGECVRCAAPHPFELTQPDTPSADEGQEPELHVAPETEPAKPEPLSTQRKDFRYRHLPWILTLAVVVPFEIIVGAVYFATR